MRIGIFGGTFDPVHLGHLILAEQCRDQARLDEVQFIPSARPPHKQERTLTPFDRRVEMLALAISGQPAFRINEIEKDRPGPSYTVDTLRQLQADDRELFLILGADSLHDLPGWHDPCAILRLANLLIVGRPGHPLPAPQVVRQSLSCGSDTPIRLEAVECPLIDIASRDLRRRVAEGKSIRYMVPRAVEAYIQDKKLWL